MYVEMDVAHFAWWLAKRPPRAWYRYESIVNCATAQYLTAHHFVQVRAHHHIAKGTRFSDGVVIWMSIPDRVHDTLSRLSDSSGYTRWCEAAKAIAKLC